MFNSTFYPTPPNVISRMLGAAGNIDNAYILEPSAGKGNILDRILSHYEYNHWKRPKLYAIEIQPELRSILEGKGYSVIWDDFLSYAPVIHFTHIIMNPPFDHAEEHLLKAWNILYDGTIICLLNKTSLEGKTALEKTILNIIADHGEVEDLGQAFRQAERPTNADIVMVTLTKQAQDKLEFETTKDYRDLPDLDEQNVTELAPGSFVGELLAFHGAAIGIYADYHKMRNKLQRYTNALGTVRTSDDRFKPILEVVDRLAGPIEGYNSFVFHCTQAAWAKILEHPKFQSLLTARARAMIQEFQTRQGIVDFNETNIRNMFEALLEKEEALKEGAIQDAFDTMTKYHKENRIYPFGWASNEAWMVNTRRVVLPYMIEYGYTGFSISYSSRDELNDIDRALCIITNTPIERITTIEQALENAWNGVGLSKMAVSLKSPRQRPGVATSTFFEIRYFLKLTIHLRFLDQQLGALFNHRAAAGRNWLPPDTGKASPYKKAKPTTVGQQMQF